jgi:hypothetical protein
MTKRKSISKKLRFEVFKRDEFKCQYCGSYSPNVILNVDHIDPVANGGTNELINLITSCFDCNQGKKARLLSDDTAVQKQRKQLELIQKRREQLELMLNWKKSLEQLTKKFSIEDILEGIDTATKKYIQFDEDGKVTQASVEEAFNKVGGICAIKNMPEIKQKLAYVKGICRNRFSYWDNQKGSIILNNYVDALKAQGWNDERITNNIKEEVIPKSKKAKNWSQWRKIIEGWTEGVNNWQDEDTSQPQVKEYSIDTLETFSNVRIGEMNDTLDALCHIGKLFPSFTEDTFRESFLNETLILLNESISTKDFLSDSKCVSFFEIPEEDFENLGVCLILESHCKELLINAFDHINLAESNYKEKDKILMKNMLKEKITSNNNSSK